MKPTDRDSSSAASLTAGGQLNSLSIVSISSSSDPSYSLTGMVREELRLLPKVLQRVEKHFSKTVKIMTMKIFLK